MFRVENRFDLSTWLADNPAVRVPLLGRFTRTDAALGLIEHDFTRAIREAKAPTAIIWGRNDNVSPVRVGVLLQGRLSDARLHVIERSGHVPMNDAVDEFKSLLAQALARPPAPKPIIATTTYRALNVECRDQSDQVYTGSFATLSLQSCRHARIEDARVTQLVMNDSSATLESVTIDSPDTAVTAVNSFITATVLDASGRIAIKTVNSQLDLAGTSIRAREKGVETDSASRVYFSVSDMQSAGYSGGLHGIWDEPEAAQ